MTSKPPHIENPQSDSDSDSDSSSEEEQIDDAIEDENSDSSEEEEEWEGSESDGSGSDSDNRSHLKPPMNQTPKTPSVKRKLETEEKSSKEPKKKKKKVSELEPEKKLTREERRRAWRRVWTKEDVIVLLQGMVNIIQKRGKIKIDSSHVSEIYDSIHHLLGPNINHKQQLVDKISLLKHRYHKTLTRLEADPLFPTPHAAKVYELSNQVWGKDNKRESTRIRLVAKEPDSERESDSEGKAAKSPGNSHVAREKQVNGKQTSTVNEKSDSESISTFLNASILPWDLPIPPPSLGEFFKKEGWNLMGTSTAARLDKRWKNVVTAETKAYLDHIDLVREQTQAMLDMLKSTDL